MGLILKEKDTKLLRDISERERAPMYEVGETTGDHQFTFEHSDQTKTKPIDLKLEDMFGNPPKTVLRDESVPHEYEEPKYEIAKIPEYAKNVLQLEEVACKDWLTNKVDRSVTGKVAKQQCAGPLQLPLNNLGVSALDYQGIKGIGYSGRSCTCGGIDQSEKRVCAQHCGSANQYHMGTDRRRTIWHFAKCQLDVAMQKSRRRRTFV
jgi:phosphoribosylformylglycinamidine synthase